MEKTEALQHRISENPIQSIFAYTLLQISTDSPAILPTNVFAQEMVPYNLQDFHRTANNIKYLSHTFSLSNSKVVPKQYNSLLFHKGRENWGERWERNRTAHQPCQHRLKIHQCQPSASENRQVQIHRNKYMNRVSKQLHFPRLILWPSGIYCTRIF